ncbi:MAG: DUF479 domain-containing protein [Fluviicola sp.]|nr:DUF479 domain-containing protein [Fluviicola sp.]
MNFLGHLFFSNNDTELMVANIFGDFVKGKDLSRYSEKIQSGIILHRKIDDYIDHHPIVLELKHQLHKPLPKVAGIAIDLYFDLLLGKHWDKYNMISLTNFINNFENVKVNRKDYDKEQFWKMMDRMKAGKWLHHSPTDYGLEKSSYGVSQMISFPNVLHTAPKIFYENEQIIESTFTQFMKEAIPHFQNYFDNKIES